MAELVIIARMLLRLEDRDLGTAVKTVRIQQIPLINNMMLS